MFPIKRMGNEIVIVKMRTEYFVVFSYRTVGAAEKKGTDKEKERKIIEQTGRAKFGQGSRFVDVHGTRRDNLLWSACTRTYDNKVCNIAKCFCEKQLEYLCNE